MGTAAEVEEAAAAAAACGWGATAAAGGWGATAAAGLAEEAEEATAVAAEVPLSAAAAVPLHALVHGGEAPKSADARAAIARPRERTRGAWTARRLRARCGGRKWSGVRLPTP